jgi:hypothetical protein
MTASDPARRNSIRPRAGVNSLLETATVPHCFTVGKFSVVSSHEARRASPTANGKSKIPPIEGAFCCTSYIRSVSQLAALSA